MGAAREKLSEWAGSGIVGTVAYNAAVALLGWLTGGWGSVLAFAGANPQGFVGWTALAFGAGLLVGVVWRNRALRSVIAARDAEIERLKAKAIVPEEPGRGVDGRLLTNAAGIGMLACDMARAALDIAEGREVKVGTDLGEAVERSLKRRDGVFRRACLMFNGMASGERLDYYLLTGDWEKYLNDPSAMKLLREAAGAWEPGPVWREL